MGIKNKTFLSLVITSVILLVFNSSSAYALSITSSSLNANTYYQGDGGSISVTLHNDNLLVEWYIAKVTVQFDWMVTDNSSFQTVVGQNIVSGGSGTYNIQFSIPSSESVGVHKYTVYYYGLYGDVNILGTGNMEVHDYNEKVYNDSVQQVQSSLNTADNSNYQSPDARSDLSQAHSAFTQSQNYANDNQWSTAVNELNTVNNLLSQASSAENSYHPSSLPFSGGSSSGYSGNYNSIDYTIYVIAVLIIGAGAGAVVFVLKRGKGIRKKIPSKKQNEKRLEVLKDRLAHGEITKDEYDQLKKEFE